MEAGATGELGLRSHSPFGTHSADSRNFNTLIVTTLCQSLNPLCHAKNSRLIRAQPAAAGRDGDPAGIALCNAVEAILMHELRDSKNIMGDAKG